MDADIAETLSASEAAARTGLSTETLRYSEREGLLPPVGRSGGRHRRYAEVDLQRLSFLIDLRATGMKRFAQLRLDGEHAGPAGCSCCSTTARPCGRTSPRCARTCTSST